MCIVYCAVVVGVVVVVDVVLVYCVMFCGVHEERILVTIDTAVTEVLKVSSRSAVLWQGGNRKKINKYSKSAHMPRSYLVKFNL